MRISPAGICGPLMISQFLSRARVRDGASCALVVSAHAVRMRSSRNFMACNPGLKEESSGVSRPFRSASRDRLECQYLSRGFRMRALLCFDRKLREDLLDGGLCG